MIRQDTSTGREDLRGFPYWGPVEGDNRRTLKIKAAKNIISIMRELKNVGSGNEPEEIRTYHRAIELLKQEGEKYP